MDGMLMDMDADADAEAEGEAEGAVPDQEIGPQELTSVP